jgi:hypothetical protein
MKAKDELKNRARQTKPAKEKYIYKEDVQKGEVNL